ncbi:toxin-antitoxin system YwqK family antitoxin [Algoriphagus aquimarinus]|uniref:toxin-antitoxin system YwqK family antitoxin n=1 Tax=Algoriphagus aquimarinus TaxID=237018 RepID=UPI00174BE69C|nr:toxin-antitoxin system YwqK family antitoxin [Algoriphagus aquimarinus]
MGNLDQGKKWGEWKVYSKINPETTDNSIFDEADPKVFDKQFNQEFPMFIINFSDDLPNGIFQENYPGGSIKSLAFFEDGELMNGYKEFYENGEKKSTGQLDKGKRVGDWQEYFESGQIKSSIAYVEGIVEGNALYYYPDGLLEFKMSYAQGEPNGLYEAYFPDGEIKEKGIFKNGNPEGEWLSKNSDRKIEIQGSFQEGVRSGEWLEQVDIIPEYFRKGNYTKGMKEGEWFVLDSNGEILQSEKYQNGNLVSVIEIRHAEKLKRPEIVNNGKGQRIYINKDGFIQAKGKITKGQRVRKWFFYYPNSNNLVSTGRFEDSEKRGVWDFYSFEGELIDQIEYRPEYIPSDESTTIPSQSNFNPYKTNPNDSALGSAQKEFHPLNFKNRVH